jgi:NADH-quinone oxidoreductase subunit J
VFWLLAAVTITSAAAMIAMRSPVYSAIWFAMALLGTSSLFLFEGAQFLAVATIIVYAGAIVVMFLFVIMLAQPQGHEYYDRISLGSPAALFSAVAGAALVVILTIAFGNLSQERDSLQAKVVKVLDEWKVLQKSDDESEEPKLQHVLDPADLQQASLRRSPSGEPNLVLLVSRSERDKIVQHDELARRLGQAVLDRPLEGHQLLVNYGDHAGVHAAPHVATVGGVLFGQYIMAVEVAGTLLLVALVGAVAIVMQGRIAQQRTRSQTPPAEGHA